MYGAAALLLAVSLLGLGSATRAVHHYPVELPGGIPAVIFEPGDPRPFPGPPWMGERLPVVVLAHGFSGNSPLMASLGRRLAHAGYASVAFEFRGHGYNPRPLSSGGFSFEGLSDDLDVAVNWARTQAQFDPDRVAVAGHSMGAFTALEWASRDPSVDAVVAIAGGAPPGGPYSPPNTLLISPSGDPEFLRASVRDAAAKLAGLERVVLDRTYGDFVRGSAVRATQIDGVAHVSVLFSDETAQRMIDWFGEALGPGVDARPGAPADGRFGWVGLGLVSWLVVLWGLLGWLAPFVPRVENPPVASPLRALGTLAAAMAAAAVLLSGVDSGSAGGPFGFVGLEISGAASGYQAIAGILLLVALGGAGALRGPGGSRTWICAFALLLASYIVMGTLLEPYLWRWLAPHRASYFFAPFVLMLPFFLAFELALRGASAWVPIVGRVVVLTVMLVALVLQVLPGAFVFVAAGFAIFFVLFEFVCYRASRVAPNPWLLAIYQAGFSALAHAMLFPIVGSAS